MKFGIQFQLQTPRPYDADSWGPDDEARIFAQALEQIEHADRLGFDYVFLTEHHFLEEYCHSAAPEVVLAAAAARTKQIRLGHGIVQMPPAINHPARVAERIASLDIVSGGRVEFGTGEGATETEIGGFGVARAEKKEAWEEATRECLRMMDTVPYPGYDGVHFSMPERNIVPKPLQRPHPPVWVAASRRETVMLAARMGIGAMGFGFETPDEAQERVERYYELIRACKRPLGQTINPALMTLGNMMCARTDEEAIEKGLRGAQCFGYVFGWMHGHQNHGRDNIYRDFRRKQEAASATLEAQDAAVALEPEDESARALYRMGRRGMFMGSPEYIRENIRAYERAHVDVLLFLSQCGDRRHEDIMGSLELFAKEVMPEFKERHHLHQRWRDEQLDGVVHPIYSTV
jgi:alkanesulfonate monooxygenase SsuD/methylene tetrahydromethanopterin reductase-like flavin-dependent oxidoreductase (luciferase family)